MSGSAPTPGTPYLGVCSNCGREIRAALFIDWQAIDPPATVPIECGCMYGHRTVILVRVDGTVRANADAWRQAEDAK